MRPSFGCFINTISIVVIVYLMINWGIFQWRNPLANEMSFFRDFKEVITFKKMEKYQPSVYQKKDYQHD